MFNGKLKARIKELEDENLLLKNNAANIFLKFLKMIKADLNGADFEFNSSPVLRSLAEWGVFLLQSFDAPNYVALTLTGAEFPVSMVIQKVGGQTPAEQLTMQKDSIMHLEDRITYLEAALADMWFAYENKDGETPHDFERQAIKSAEKLIGPLGGKRFQKLLCDCKEGEE